jgi:hypothetical protein
MLHDSSKWHNILHFPHWAWQLKLYVGAACRHNRFQTTAKFVLAPYGAAKSSSSTTNQTSSSMGPR